MQPTWRERKRDQLKQLLFGTALQLFRDQGYEATSVAQIARCAGVAKGTFFNHFPSKDQVLAEWHRGVTRNALAAVTAASHTTCREAIAALMDELASVACSEPDLLQMTARHVVASDLLSQEEQSLDAELLAFIEQQIADGTERGELARGPEGGLFAALILTTLTGTTHEWVVCRQSFDLAATLNQRLAFLFRAAAAHGNSKE